MPSLPENWMELHYELAPGTAKRRIRDDLFFLCPHTGELHEVNESGRDIWEALEAGRTPRDVYEELCRETDGDPAEIRADLEEFLVAFMENGIMQVRS